MVSQVAEKEAAYWCPRLRHGLEVEQVIYRGLPWLLLEDSATGAHFRLPGDASRLLERLDGKHTLSELIEVVPGNDAQHLLALLLEMERAGLLEGERSPWWQKNAAASPAGNSRLLPFLFWRLRMLNPDPLLEKLSALARLLFHRWMLWPWLLLQLLGWLTLALNWDAWVLHWQVRFSDPTNLLSLWLLYPLVKLLHELGHALAVKSFGGRVHHAGLFFLVFTPLPFVDASASHTMPRSRRMAVAGAGILVELALSAAALLVWVNLAPGLMRDLAFDLVVIGGLSTLVFNGNPLLRYDGYYLLSDALEIPNLASRSRALLFDRFAVLFTGVSPDAPARVDRAEQRWLFWYGLASLCYRPLVALGIALFVAKLVPGLGLLLAAWVVLVLVVWPLMRSLFRLFVLARDKGGLSRLSLASLLLLLLVAGVGGLPVASSTQAQGVLELPEQSQLRAEAEGFIQNLEVKSGDSLTRGQLILTLANEELVAAEKAARARLQELLARSNGQLLDDPAQHAIYQEQIRRARSRLAQLRDELASLQLYSPMDGRFQLLLPERADGRHVRRGELIGYLLPAGSRGMIEVALQQEQMERMDGVAVQAVVHPEADPSISLSAVLTGKPPTAVDRLPDSALGSLGGGSIPVDNRDASGLTPLQPVFLVRLDAEIPANNLYRPHRFSVRFEHDGLPLAAYLYRKWRMLIARQLQI